MSPSKRTPSAAGQAVGGSRPQLKRGRTSRDLGSSLPVARSALSTGAGSMNFGPNQEKDLAVMNPTARPSQYLVNADHWARIETAWQTIMNHPVFTGITNEMPLQLGESSIQPFKVDDCEVALKGTGTYTAGMNAFWCSPFFTTTPGVPINKNGV